MHMQPESEAILHSRCFERIPVTFPITFPVTFILDHTTRIRRSVLGRYLGRIDPRFQISRDLSVESSPEVSEVSPGSVQGSNPASTRPGSITAYIGAEFRGEDNKAQN